MAYTAPNEDTIVVVGGLGTQANKAQLNGGGATKAVWDAGSPSDFINTNGGPKRTASCAFTTASKNLNGTDIGNGITVGTLCYVSTGDGSHITAGVYEITTVTDNDNIVCAQIDDDGTNDTGVTVNVGGALDGLQNALDNPVNNAASYSRYIYDNIATETVTTTVKADTFGGSVSTKVYVIGYNSTLAAEGTVILTTTTDITGEASAVDQALFAVVAVDYLEYRNIDFNAGGKDASRAVFAGYAVGTGDAQYSTFYNCNFYGAEADGFKGRPYYASFINCEFYLNGARGFNQGGAGAYLTIVTCSVHDNDTDGIGLRTSSSLIIGNLCYDNGKDGSGSGIDHFGEVKTSHFLANTCFGNASDGIEMNGSDYSNTFINNAAIGNGAHGFDFQSIGLGDIGFFGFNLAGANTTAHYSNGADGTFAAYANGDNVASAQTADQLLKTITDGSEDLTPETGSDLIDAGLDRTA